MNFRKQFWDEEIEEGYYHKILITGLRKKSGLQSNWHNITFLRIKKYLKPSKKHLDYACGPGSLIGLYSDSDSFGFDISKKQIDFANNEYSENINKFTYQKNKIFEKGPYDIITICGLFEYLEDQEIIDLVNELGLLLNKGGKILATTPNYGSLFRIIEKLSEFIGEVSYKNVNINKFNKKRLSNLLQMTDYKKVKIIKFLNFGVFFSFISHSAGIYIEELIGKIFQNYFGLLLFIEIKK